jgi:hypothetical protein
MGGGNSTVGMEGFCWKVKGVTADGGDIVELNWSAFLSDSQQQDARTSYHNCNKFIKWLKSKGLLLSSNSVLYIHSDGCPKQYKSGTGLKLRHELAKEHKIAIDWMVTCPHHGKNLVDALAGRDKYDCRCKLIRGMCSAQVDDMGNRISEAEKCCVSLNDKIRIKGLQEGDTKHKRREGDSYIHTYHYEVSDYTDDEPIPLKNTAYEVWRGFYRGKKEIGNHRQNGMKEMFHFYFHPGIPANTCTIRRLPCNCEACYKQIKKPWDPSLGIKDQPKFQPPTKTCEFGPVTRNSRTSFFLSTGPLRL